MFFSYLVFNLYLRNIFVLKIYKSSPCGERNSSPFSPKTVCGCSGLKLDEENTGLVRTICIGKCHDCKTIAGEKK